MHLAVLPVEKPGTLGARQRAVEMVLHAITYRFVFTRYVLRRHSRHCLRLFAHRDFTQAENAGHLRAPPQHRNTLQHMSVVLEHKAYRHITWITASVVEMYPSGSGLSLSVRLAVISRVTWQSTPRNGNIYSVQHVCRRSENTCKQRMNMVEPLLPSRTTAANRVRTPYQ